MQARDFHTCNKMKTLSIEYFGYSTFTSVLLNARNVAVVSSLSFISGFLTNGSFTAGATETTAGAGF